MPLPVAQSSDRAARQRGDLIVDTGFVSEKNIKAYAATKIEALIAVSLNERHSEWTGRHNEPPSLFNEPRRCKPSHTD
jgi:hypothetical protein